MSDRVEGRREEGAARTEAGRRERRRGRRSIAALDKKKRREGKGRGEKVIVGRETPKDRMVSRSVGSGLGSKLEAAVSSR